MAKHFRSSLVEAVIVTVLEILLVDWLAFRTGCLPLQGFFISVSTLLRSVLVVGTCVVGAWLDCLSDVFSLLLFLCDDVGSVESFLVFSYSPLSSSLPGWFGRLKTGLKLKHERDFLWLVLRSASVNFSSRFLTSQLDSKFCLSLHARAPSSRDEVLTLELVVVAAAMWLPAPNSFRLLIFVEYVNICEKEND